MHGHRLDEALRDEDGDGLAREGARDAEAVGEDGDGDHLVLGHLGEELVVGGLSSSNGEGGETYVSGEALEDVPTTTSTGVTLKEK